MSDPRLLWVLLAVLLLLLPDLSEIELGGVLSLKRAVSEVQGENEQLKGEVAELRVTTAQIASQQQQVNIHLGEKLLAEGFANFQADVMAGDTGPLTAAEETGAYAHLAFSAALAGLIPELFGRWQDRLTLVGWVLEDDGKFQPNYVHDEAPMALVDTLAGDLDPTAGVGAPVQVTRANGFLTVTAYALTDPSLGVGEQLIGALSIVVEDDEPVDETNSDAIVTLAAGAEAAAGAYALLLIRVLGNPSTLDPS